MDEHEERRFIEETRRSINESQYGTNIENITLGRKLVNLCRDYRKASAIFKLLVEAMEEDSYSLHMGFMYTFLEMCWWDLSRWESIQIQFQTTNNRLYAKRDTDTVRLFLEFSFEMNNIMEKKGELTFFLSPHPVNHNLFNGMMANIPLLLRYGLGLEFMEICNMLKRLDSYNFECYEKLRQLPDYKRVFLVLQVIRTYNHPAGRWNPKAASRALRSIWRSIPDPNLCRREFFQIFACFDSAEFVELKTISEQYAKFVCEEVFTELVQPRTLVHLSRCKIRKVLNLNRELPTGIYDLKIPKRLHNYLLLES